MNMQSESARAHSERAANMLHACHTELSLSLNEHGCGHDCDWLIYPKIAAFGAYIVAQCLINNIYQ